MKNRKQIGYKVVSQYAAGGLDSRVGEFLQEGWELYGPPFTVADNYCQAIVLYREEAGNNDEFRYSLEDVNAAFNRGRGL